MILVRRGRGAPAICASLAVMVALLAGCGSSNSSTKSTSTGASTPASSGSSPAVTAAKAEYAKYSAAQPPVVFPVLPKQPPSGLTVTLQTCSLPVCAVEADAAVEAAKRLGWKVTRLASPLTPAGYKGTLDQIVAHPTNLVVITSIVPNSFIATQLNALQAKKIPVVSIAPSDEPTAAGPVIGGVAGPPQLGLSGQLMGDAVVNDAGAGAKTVFVIDPSITSWANIKSGFTKVVKGAGGNVDTLEISLQNVGKQVPAQIVSYVQSHPDVKYVAFAEADLAAGVPQALKSAGLKDVKILSRAPQATTLADIKSGQEWASVAEENSTGGYRAMDQLARAVEKVPLGDLRNPAGWHQILTSQNVTQTSSAPITPGSPDAFLKAWHVK